MNNSHPKLLIFYRKTHTKCITLQLFHQASEQGEKVIT